MSLLSDADIAQMRGVMQQALPGTAVIGRDTFISDSGGGGTTTFTASGTVDCRIAPVSGDEQVTGGRVSPDAEWVVTLPAGTVVDRTDQVTIAGSTYDIVAMRAPRSWELSRRLEVKERT